ncbi:MAG: dTMP kinase [Nitrososphaeria archaeon]|nr:dTMP kinase [Aigarchaeota archaeon]MCX8187984.1 dTMP kinase [Nitrososphaeria archaeon]MDW8021907.1 dTMP kinase [Nitrososphaerota archaeon]
MRGLLIAFEGVDGAGKTTQAKRLVKRLSENGLQTRYTCEPTRSGPGRILRAIAYKGGVDARVEALLFAADRLIHLRRVIEPLLERGVIVVSDRYLHSSLAYQSVTTGNLMWVEEINRFARRPDLGLLLDVDPEVGLKRLRRKRTRFEDADFLKKVRERYLEYVERGELVRIDAARGPDEVFSEIVKVIEEALSRMG